VVYSRKLLFGFLHCVDLQIGNSERKGSGHTTNTHPGKLEQSELTNQTFRYPPSLCHREPRDDERNHGLFCFVLFCFVLFCFVLFCFVLFVWALPCLLELCAALFDIQPLYSVQER
jgi:hypothetical protein